MTMYLLRSWISTHTVDSVLWYGTVSMDVHFTTFQNILPFHLQWQLLKYEKDIMCFETSENARQTPRRYFTGDTNLQQYRCVNLRYWNVHKIQDHPVPWKQGITNIQLIVYETGEPHKTQDIRGCIEFRLNLQDIFPKISWLCRGWYERQKRGFIHAVLLYLLHNIWGRWWGSAKD